MPLSFDEYQKGAAKTDLTPDKGEGLVSISFMDKVLGLVGESGEFADKIKKILRDQEGKLTKSDKDELIKELGDVLWYLALLAPKLDASLDEVAQRNLDKLAKRHASGKLTGSGDNR